MAETKTIHEFDVVTTMANSDKLPLWNAAGAATKAITYANFITAATASLVLSDYLKKNGTVALTGDWDIGSGRKISGDKFAARSASGLRLEDDGGNLGIMIDDGGNVHFGAPIVFTRSDLTVASGAITPTLSYHRIDTESAAATDDLVTINGGSVGQRLLLASVSGTRDTTIKHGTGNIRLVGGTDFVLAGVRDKIELICSGTEWHEQSRATVA
jgi:hypothetical protein